MPATSVALARWLEHHPGGHAHNQLSHAGDGLGLVERILLGDGESFVSSGRLDPAGDDDTDLLYAVVDTSRGQKVRVGIIPAEAAEKWRAGNRGGTADLDTGQIRRLHSELSDANERAKRAAKAADKAWDSGTAPTDPALLGTEPAAEGRMKTGWGDLSYNVFLTDDEPTSWQTSIEVDSEADSIKLNPKDLRKLLGKLDELGGAMESVVERWVEHLPGRHDQSSHGRKGAGGLGGGLAELVAAAKRTGEPVKLAGGLNSETMLFKLPDGGRVIRKRASGDAPARKTSADAQELSGLVADAIGARVARVERDDDDTTWVEFVDGATAAETDVGLDGRDGQLLGLLDVIAPNPDRNDGNLMVDGDGQLVGIDQDMAWYGAEALKSDDEDTRDYYGDPLGAVGPISEARPHKHFVKKSFFTPEWVDNPLTPDDVAETRRRLEGLRQEFTRLGRGDWLDFSLRMLDAVAPHAKGEVSIYA